jgi:hypothetical protein
LWYPLTSEAIRPAGTGAKKGGKREILEF